MGILVKKVGKQRDWMQVGLTVAEAVAQATILGPVGLSNALSALFRGVEGLRGRDKSEQKAYRLVVDATSYALAATISQVEFESPPPKEAVSALVQNIIKQIAKEISENDVEIHSESLQYPSDFVLVASVRSSLYNDLIPLRCRSRKETVEQLYDRNYEIAVNRLIARDPDYFLPFTELLEQNAKLDGKRIAWDKYRASQIRWFDDTPLFTEDDETGVTIAQVYQPLRCWWSIFVDDESRPDEPRTKIHTVSLLESEVMEWLNSNDRKDRIRLISGGPGSGKSTFARYLSAKLSLNPFWRVLFVPLQRLTPDGNLESRINKYFSQQREEPFSAEVPPLKGLGRDGHKDWLIVFDGLDELTTDESKAESAAQELASSVVDMRGSLGESANVRFLILGRAPSMQEATQRLSLQGRGTLFVADMKPIAVEHKRINNVEIDDPSHVAELDQRHEFWKRWAVAKGVAESPPAALEAEALSDLTKEPLLFYLLLISGYAGERWPEAAENRNRVYEAIFERIWERERNKLARIKLNDLGQEGFETLIRALGLAAWRGGGRTGDEGTFEKVRDDFVAPTLLKKAKECGAADLKNVAILFYTRKDETAGQGYEFLHKSFGEYLTACALLDAVERWTHLVKVAGLEQREFLRRWYKLTGLSPITLEVVGFLRNQARLRAESLNPNAPWEKAREWVSDLSEIVDLCLKDGLPAHETATVWRHAERQARNAEETLFAVLDATARAAYPLRLVGKEEAEGGWCAGPIRIGELQDSHTALENVLQRLSIPIGLTTEYVRFIDGPVLVYSANNIPLINGFMSRLDLSGSILGSRLYSKIDLQGSKLHNSIMFGGHFISADFDCADLSGSNCQGTMFSFSSIENAILKKVDFAHSRLTETSLSGSDVTGATFVSADLSTVDRKNVKGASAFRGAKKGATRRGKPTAVVEHVGA